ncbi:MAG: metal ABC transporter ATP-binding protein [Solirubrobacterales bacterium]|nr:metal ABC transporter ATP-binding protein [Solirubrobacterales bacterium]
MPGDRLIHADHATLAYDSGEPALTELSVELPAGELVILLGPNGGGKTTFLRALVGELQPIHGTIAVESKVAYLPQHDSSRSDFPVSALDVVLMGTLSERRFWQRARRAEKQRSIAALERVGLAGSADRTYGELSGGQRRRVLLARTIVGGAEVIALDEPLAGVDPSSAAVIRATLGSLRDEGRLVIEASHDIEHARIADRVICLNGRVVADGAPFVVLTDAKLRETYAADLTVIGDVDGRPVLATADTCGRDHYHDG